MSDHFDDQPLRNSLLAEVPERGADYWDRFDQLLGQRQATTDSDSTDTGSGNVDITTTDELAGRRNRRWSRSLVLAAASLVVVAALFGSTLLRSNDTPVETGFATDPRITELEALPGPTMNLDNWNAVYGVWDCTAANGAGGWVDPFQSTDDDLGIHSHGDGLVSIHPFVEASAGRNATFGLFADAMNIEITNTSITLDDGRVLEAGATCNGEPAVVQMRRWESAPDLEADPTIPPIMITEAFNEQRFYNDLEVWTLALAPLDADVPLPPSDRFDRLAAWWFTGGTTVDSMPGTAVEAQPGEDTRPEGVPVQALEVPANDGLTIVRLLETGAHADELIADIHSRLGPPDRPYVGETIAGSGTRWEAVSPHARSVVNLFTFEVLDEAPDIDPTLSCQVVWVPELQAIAKGGCSRSDEPILGFTRVRADSDLTNESMVLWDAPPNSAWMVVTTTTGSRFAANVVDSVSHTSWGVARGGAQRVEVLDQDLNVIWSDDQ